MTQRTPLGFLIAMEECQRKEKKYDAHIRYPRTELCHQLTAKSDINHLTSLVFPQFL